MQNLSWIEMEVADAEASLGKLSSEDRVAISKRHNFDILSHLYRQHGIVSDVVFGHVGTSAQSVIRDVGNLKKPSPERPPESD